MCSLHAGRSVHSPRCSKTPIGIAEAKQLPLEHPKDYDRVSGATSWASGAFSMFRTAEFRDLGGFDHDSFFMYGDDVDLSWRYRLRGFQVIFQPAAAVFHDKRLGPDGEWLASDTERYFSAESALMLAHKWSRDDVLERLLESMSGFPDEIIRRAVAGYLDRRERGALPERLDPEGTTGEFVAGNYAVHRW
ncbi:glycosyltransferase [Herbiconiux sp.]|uniref:glycosyltransferase family 2 protein n=1 Tax=Herbiconiux sp. TaxID=1871186 RepID=UPI0025BB67A0|nr:glycosyltransferase [Herbiconiux sp.]